MSYTITNIPDNWEIKKMPQVVKWGSGGTPKATEKKYYEGGTIPWLVIGDLNDGIVTSSASKITELGLQNSSAKMIPEGTLLVAMYGSIGKLGIAGMECCTNQAIAYAKELYGVTAKYMFYFMCMMKSELISMGKGDTQKNISQTVLNSLDVIVPPLDEQESIVARIEELLSQLNDSVETLNTARCQLGIYREAVLENAFSGKLTNAQLIEEKLLGELIEQPRYGTSKKCTYACSSNSLPVFRIPNIDHNNGTISHDDIKYASFSEKELSGIKLEVGDVLIIRSNGSESLVGRAAIVSESDINATFAGYLMRLRVHDKQSFLPKFLLYYLGSHKARIYITGKAKSTSGVNNINSEEIKGLTVPVYSIEDQQKIIDAIEARLSVCDDILGTVKTGTEKAEALGQSILKKAFEGRL